MPEVSKAAPTETVTMKNVMENKIPSVEFNVLIQSSQCLQTSKTNAPNALYIITGRIFGI